MVPPCRVLITGSSKDERVESAVQSLREEFGEQYVWGTKCDVREAEDVKNLVAFAQEKLKYIDIWPGMVTTDLLMSGATTKQAKFFINVLAEPAEVVAEFLVPNIRSTVGNGSMKPSYIRFLTGVKAYSQIFSACLKTHLKHSKVHVSAKAALLLHKRGFDHVGRVSKSTIDPLNNHLDPFH